MSDPADKRAYERFSSDMSIWIRPSGDEGDFLLVEVVNISAGGILFELDYQMEMETSLELRFELPQNNDLVEATAVVRHAVDQGDHTLIGVQFTDVRNYTIPVLMAYLEALFR